MQGTTITTTFKPTNLQPRITKLRAMERQILRNVGIIQQFNVSNESGPTSPKQALCQRHKYQAIKENCDLTKRTINHALSLSNANNACTQAYRGIFTTLKRMLINELHRAEAINTRANIYCHEFTIPEPPPLPKPATQIPDESLAQRLGLSSDTSESSYDSPMYSPTSYSSASSE
jgi:hypothetical protein